MKNKKIYLIILITVLVILTGIIFIIKTINNKKTVVLIENNQIDNQKDLIPLVSPIINKTIKVSNFNTNHNIYPVSINWSGDISFSDNYIDVYTADGIGWDLNFKERLVRYFDLSAQATSEDEDMIVFEGDNDNSLIVKKKNLSISYTKDLLTGNVKLGSGKVGVDNLKIRTIKMIKNLIDMPTDVEIYITSVNQEVDILFNDLENFEAKIIEIEAIYKFKNKSLQTASSVPIVIKYLEDGTLIKLDLHPPFIKSEFIDKFPIKSLASIKEFPVSNFDVFSIKGDSEVYGDEIVLSKVDIIKNYLGYLYLNDNEFLQPYMFFEGKSNYEGEEVEVLMGIPALKEEIYQ